MIVCRFNVSTALTQKWCIAFGGSGSERSVWNGIVELKDTGHIAVIGWTNSFGEGIADMFLTALTNKGKILWCRTFGGSNGDTARGVIQSSVNSSQLFVAGHSNAGGTTSGVFSSE